MRFGIGVGLITLTTACAGQESPLPAAEDLKVEAIMCEDGGGSLKCKDQLAHYLKMNREKRVVHIVPLFGETSRSGQKGTLQLLVTYVEGPSATK